MHAVQHADLVDREVIEEAIPQQRALAIGELGGSRVERGAKLVAVALLERGEQRIDDRAGLSERRRIGGPPAAGAPPGPPPGPPRRAPPRPPPRPPPRRP